VIVEYIVEVTNIKNILSMLKPYMADIVLVSWLLLIASFIAMDCSINETKNKLREKFKETRRERK